MKTVVTPLRLNSPKLRICFSALVLVSIASILAACQRSSSPTPTLSFGTDQAAALTSVPMLTAAPTPAIYEPSSLVRVSTRQPKDALMLSDEELSARWLSGTPCRPSCWEGITPGKTTVEETFNILSANPLFTEVRMDRFPEDRLGYISFFIRSSSLDQGVVIYHLGSTEQTVFTVNLYGLLHENLGELIRAFGKPSHVQVAVFPSEPGGTTYDRWYVDVLWIPQGLALFAEGATPPPEIDADLLLSGATYYSPSLEGYKEAMDYSTLYYVKPWHGYDSFEAYRVPTPTPTPTP